MLGEWKENKNKNEYDTVLSTKKGSLSKLAANYGIPYQVTINNASGKRLKITPNWSGSTEVANIVLKNAAGTCTLRVILLLALGIIRLAATLPLCPLLFRVRTTVIYTVKL